jgi:hypothetical protein
MDDSEVPRAESKHLTTIGADIITEDQRRVGRVLLDISIAYSEEVEPTDTLAELEQRLVNSIIEDLGLNDIEVNAETPQVRQHHGTGRSAGPLSRDTGKGKG